MSIKPIHNLLLVVVTSVTVAFVAPSLLDACVQEQTSVTLTTVEKGDLQVTVELPATVRGYQIADLYSKVGGYLKEISVDIGDKVTAGQVLASLDIPEMKAQLLQRRSLVAQAEAEARQAEAAVVQAKSSLSGQNAAIAESQVMLEQKKALEQFESIEFQRVQKLVNRGSLRRDLLDAAQYKLVSARAEFKAGEAHVLTVRAKLESMVAGVAKAEADLESAKSRIDVAKANQAFTTEMMNYASIKAPFDGLVSKRWHDSGSFIQSAEGNSAAKPVLQILRNDKVRVSIQVSMAQVNLVDVGDQVTIRDIDGLDGITFAGSVSRMSAEVDPQSRMMEIEVDLDNKDGQLKPGFLATLM